MGHEKSKEKKKHSSSRRRKEEEDDRRRRKRRDRDDDDDDDGDRRKHRRKRRSRSREDRREKPDDVVEELLESFPSVVNDLKRLLMMIDDGQAVDIRGLSERALIKILRRLFASLRLKENNDGVYLRPANVKPTLEVVGPLLTGDAGSNENQHGKSASDNDSDSGSEHASDGGKETSANDSKPSCSPEVASPPRRRMMGPEMPSAELLAAAARLTEAEAELREAELEGDDGLFIGPPPPAVVSEAESANDAERFEEVTRIMSAEADNPYDILGVNHKMPANNLKKRYWKLSLMVHPDKCTHPQAHEAFVVLNKAFKDLQDPNKRKAMDDKIKMKEEKEAMMAELKVMREAAQWRRLQGIAMEGDDELLADVSVKAAPVRDEWMTSLPPERRPGGVSMQSTTFSKTGKEGRGDTSSWTDAPSDRAQKAKMSYLEAYNQATALASNVEEAQRQSADAELVDKYNKAKRSKSLVEKYKEEASSRSKKKSKKKSDKEKEEWVGQHPWKPWDRENDLTAGRQKVKLDADHMSQGLTSRFSSGAIQRNFL
uniref:J domain-containing protein n=1 Tax=Kalanchoe fedtschenkoi TaxID=63787 RepID=A0A7N0UBN0_KALFE